MKLPHVRFAAHFDQRIDEIKETWRSELRRVEEVLNARAQPLGRAPSLAGLLVAAFFGAAFDGAADFARPHPAILPGTPQIVFRLYCAVPRDSLWARTTPYAIEIAICGTTQLSISEMQDSSARRARRESPPGNRPGTGSTKAAVTGRWTRDGVLTSSLNTARRLGKPRAQFALQLGDDLRQCLTVRARRDMNAIINYFAAIARSSCCLPDGRTIVILARRGNRPRSCLQREVAPAQLRAVRKKVRYACCGIFLIRWSSYQRSSLPYRSCGPLRRRAFPPAASRSAVSDEPGRPVGPPALRGALFSDHALAVDDHDLRYADLRSSSEIPR